MTVLIAASAVRTCFGDGAQTFAALLRGECGAAPIRHFDPAVLNVTSAYQIAGPDAEPLFQPSRWLSECVVNVIEQAGLDLDGRRVVALVGTGLRELRVVERCAIEPLAVATEALHFESAVRRSAPQVSRVITLSNACSAGGHALALAQDLLELDEADVVIAASTDGMTESMLGMIGRFSGKPTTRIRPFDRDRTGVLLGEGAAAVMVVPEGGVERPRLRLLGSGVSCDAVHETVPAAEGIWRSMEDAFCRTGRTPSEVDLVLTHGTGTALNDPLEAALLGRLFASRHVQPLITGIKGAIGHTSGSSSLMSLDAAMRCVTARVVPPLVGLQRSIPEAEPLHFVVERPQEAPVGLAQINSFGFGGVNVVTLVEAIA